MFYINNLNLILKELMCTLLFLDTINYHKFSDVLFGYGFLMLIKFDFYVDCICYIPF